MQVKIFGLDLHPDELTYVSGTSIPCKIIEVDDDAEVVEYITKARDNHEKFYKLDDHCWVKSCVDFHDYVQHLEFRKRLDKERKEGIDIGVNIRLKILKDRVVGKSCEFLYKGETVSSVTNNMGLCALVVTGGHPDEKHPYMEKLRELFYEFVKNWDKEKEKVVQADSRE